MENLDNRWLSVEEIAAYLGIKRDTVYKWIDEEEDARPQGRATVEIQSTRGR